MQPSRMGPLHDLGESRFIETTVDRDVRRTDVVTSITTGPCKQIAVGALTFGNRDFELRLLLAKNSGAFGTLTRIFAEEVLALQRKRAAECGSPD